MSVNELFIAADIGGTKTEVGLFSAEAEQPRLVERARFLNNQHRDLKEVLELFMSTIGDERKGRVRFLSLGVAAPVDEPPIRLTNIDWTIEPTLLKESLGLDAVYAINDIVATAWGIPFLSAQELFCLNSGKPRRANIGLICAGTGLGEALVVCGKEGYRPVPSEAGHADFAPETPVEVGLMFFLQNRFGHVSYERVASGQGIRNIYEFLTLERPVPDHLAKRMTESDPSTVITDEALKEYGDLACREALEIFIAVLAREASNLALRGLTAGGIYLGGGIAPRIVRLLDRGRFMAPFLRKGRFEGFLRDVPVHVILKPDIALMGAANYGLSMRLAKELIL